jgi:hypothetical protein
VIFRVRKLFSVPVLAFLMAIPPALASPGAGELDAVPHLVAVSHLPSAPSEDADNAPSLIGSSVAGDPLDHQEARDRLRAATLGARRDVARQRAAAAQGEPVSDLEPAATAPVPPQLEAIAACESGGDPAAIGGGGAYRGKYQFSPATWQAVGGSGDPAAAPEAEQDRRAALLYAQSGPSQWPVCGG